MYVFQFCLKNIMIGLKVMKNQDSQFRNWLLDPLSKTVSNFLPPTPMITGPAKLRLFNRNLSTGSIIPGPDLSTGGCVLLFIRSLYSLWSPTKPENKRMTQYQFTIIRKRIRNILSPLLDYILQHISLSKRGHDLFK